MAKVTNPLLSGDASGNFGKRMIFRKGGVVTRMFSPKNPNSAAQIAHRTAFREYWMAALTQAVADLLYAAINHLHDDRYSLNDHGHDHGALSGLSDDDHPQYYDQTRGDARYALIEEPGVVKMFAGTIAPIGWGFCDGGSYLRSANANLFAVIGTTFGSVDGDHFSVPDLRGRAPIGVGTGTGLTARALGANVGSETETLTIAQMPTHNHKVGTANGVGDNTYFSAGVVHGYSSVPGYQDYFSYDQGGGGAHGNMQPSVGLNFIIKF